LGLCLNLYQFTKLQENLKPFIYADKYQNVARGLSKAERCLRGFAS
jgi:hypothetical protein